MALQFHSKTVGDYYNSLDNWGKVYYLIAANIEARQNAAFDIEDGNFNPDTDKTPEELKKQLLKTLKQEFKLSAKKN